MSDNLMPPEILELSRAERILSHLKDGYDLPVEDHSYFEQISVSFRIIHVDEKREDSVNKIKTIFPDLTGKQISQLLDDTVFIYDDFFTVNREIKRVIQEWRHEQLWKKCVEDGDYSTASRELKAIDELNGIYKTKGDAPIKRRFPKVVRTSDKSALKKLAKDG